MESCVLVIVTGGTICMEESARGREPTRSLFFSALASSQGSVIEPHPPTVCVTDEMGASRQVHMHSIYTGANGETCLYAGFEFQSLLDSSSMDSRHWNQIVDCVRANLASFSAIVVVHGTDTMAYTASALSFMLGSVSKPIILTGSQASMSSGDREPYENVVGALTVASQGIVSEVCVFFNGMLMRGTRTTKLSASANAAFASPNEPVLAVRREGRVSYNCYGTLRCGRHEQELTLASGLSDHVPVDTSVAAILRVYPGMRSEVVEAVVSLPGLRGLVLETFGAGNMSCEAHCRLLRSLAAAVLRGIVIVNVSQCLHGSVGEGYVSSRRLAQAGVVMGYDMTTEAAYTKLLFLLASTHLQAEHVRRLMSLDLCGEVTCI